LEVDVFPRIGARPIADIEAPHVLEIVRLVEARGVRETAKRGARQLGSPLLRQL
jgi:hypothetical protein